MLVYHLLPLGNKKIKNLIYGGKTLWKKVISYSLAL